LTVKYTVGGTATLGSDYTGIAATPATKTVTFGVGSATATVTVDPTADTTIERNETVSLRLASGTGYTIGTTAAVVGTITNDDFPILIGSNSADTIIGTDGNDTIEGGDGADTLTGGLGADVFRFASGIGGSGIDRITDFTASQKDVIQLENSVFTALPTPGVLAGAAFIRGAAATTAAHRIGYNPASGDLWYDADGIGAGMSITFAQLNTGVVGMTAARFVVT
jgi:chitinase